MERTLSRFFADGKYEKIRPLFCPVCGVRVLAVWLSVPYVYYLHAFDIVCVDERDDDTLPVVFDVS